MVKISKVSEELPAFFFRDKEKMVVLKKIYVEIQETITNCDRLVNLSYLS
jgi:hypothetical protein